jgi:Ca2+-binding RTX toxin-like protein
MLAFGGATASTEGTVVVHGSAGSSHLRLSVEGNHLVVSGQMAHAAGAGCRLESRRLAFCRLRGSGAIVVVTGSAPDKVRVLDPLPAPLTVHLGDGSDKFIGSTESDTCYPEGSRRNRCVGGGGDDVCITGPENSDCVGGGGDDFCQTGAGSDGCWGGPGNDVCRMGRGQDGCHGEEGDDRLFGGPGSDQLYGGRSFDHCDGLPGLGHSHSCEAGPRR